MCVFIDDYGKILLKSVALLTNISGSDVNGGRVRARLEV